MQDRSRNGMRVAVVGGGLVGCLAACFFAKHGHHVDLYELRDDIRKMSHIPGRSINMALSNRGLEALDAVGIKQKVSQHCIPMKGRLIHNLDATKHIIPYGTRGQYINSISRRLLNEILLTEAENYTNVSCHFRHKLVEVNLDNASMKFKEGERLVEQTADLVVGCDGAHSSVRKEMLKRSMFNFSQMYIPHGYVELAMPATSSGQFAMEENYLHIWPRGSFMMIALPNKDLSYTCTLFMPFDMFQILNSRKAVLEFYQQNFPDSIPLLGENNLVQAILTSNPSHMLSVKCSPYHVSDKSVILGDAAHAMVPFYGQGMNCGFEDCLILEELLNEYKWNLRSALSAYSQKRNPDAEAIVDLAMYNYIEMRDLVNSRLFRLRVFVDRVLHVIFPSVWLPLYSMVTFSRTRYHIVIKKREWQNKILKWFCMTCCLASTVILVRQGFLLFNSNLL